MLFKADDEDITLFKTISIFSFMGLRKNILALKSVSKLSQVILKLIGELRKICVLHVCVMHRTHISEPTERKQVHLSNAKRQEESLFLAR